MTYLKPRKDLNTDGLLHSIRDEFEQLEDPTPHTTKISLADALMSGLALFMLKDPSLLAFEKRRNDANIKTLFRIQQIPRDTDMRELLDNVEPGCNPSSK